MTEDHPLDYANFEGIIPSGYGAGEVIVWDQGIYIPLDENEDAASDSSGAEEIIKDGLKAGKLLFNLQGNKLKGIWTLVRMKKTEKDWLLIKHKDKFASETSHPWKDNSVLSGETLSDLQSEKNSPTKKKLEKKQKTTSMHVLSRDSKKAKKKTEKKTLKSNNAQKSTRKSGVKTDATDTQIAEILSQLDNESEDIQLNAEGNKINLTSLNKPFWPSYDRHSIISKRDYLRYLATVSPWLLNHLRDRLITLIRFPQGIQGPKFFQKHWSENLPDFVETVRVFTEHEHKDQDFLLCNNLSSLIWLGQIADLELHTTHTRISPQPDAKTLSNKFTGSVKNLENSLLNYPDYMVFDLDPYLYSGEEKKGDEPELHRKGFRQTCKAALWFKELFDELSLKAFVKTSGKTGLHIYVPIKRNIDYDKVREISHTICNYILARHPAAVTTDWSVSKRVGKVFLDHNMNARSKSLASIFSPRVSKEAAVSTPLSWDELDKIYPTDFTIETLPLRLKKQGDLWTDILSSKNDLTSLFSRLSTII